MKQSTIPALAERQDATIEARVITVSPELAAEWLTRNDRNRTLNLNAVTQFAADTPTRAGIGVEDATTPAPSTSDDIVSVSISLSGDRELVERLAALLLGGAA